VKAVPPEAPDGWVVNTSFDTAPAVTVKLSVLELVALPLIVALARSVTEPATLPVTVSVATPPLAATAAKPVTEPVPLVWLKVMVAVLSIPLVTVFPSASSIVAVNGRVEPDDRLAVDPDNTICEAAPDATTAELAPLAAVQDCQTAVTV
jgi:hypothetical protein